MARKGAPKDSVLHIQMGCRIQHDGERGASAVRVSVSGHREQAPLGVLQLCVHLQRYPYLISLLHKVQGLSEPFEHST